MKMYFRQISALIIILLCITSSGAADNQYEQVYQFVINLANSNDIGLTVWIENTSGTYKHTVYVTRDIAKYLLDAKRPSISPVWAHRRVDQWGSGYPTSENTLPDAVTSATPSAGEFVWNWTVPSTLAPGNYYYYVEANVGKVYNEYYTDWPNGEPSVVYRGSLKVDVESTNTTGTLIGHGHEVGDVANWPLNITCGWCRHDNGQPDNGADIYSRSFCQPLSCAQNINDIHR